MFSRVEIRALCRQLEFSTHTGQTMHWCFNSSQRCPVGLRSELFVGLFEFLNTRLVKPCLYGAGFTHRGTVIREPKRAFPELLPQGWKSTKSVYAVALTDPGLSLTIEYKPHIYGLILLQYRYTYCGDSFVIGYKSI